ncbi:hypothetical protein [Glycomyces harbinensis]|uniref:Uncharacterized protein n=1 Tax=Glycomyces harbinensis TaxID=58114 RepID=A0A1G6ZSR0_9ACTN|nr:hypothetical protein [Glycomyces harbinensis]SDE05579.1 hypothetical protein SAMN05216270_111184 [Glycomyces harbinensis]
MHTITGDGQDVTSARATIADQPGLHLESIKAVFNTLKGTGGSTGKDTLSGAVWPAAASPTTWGAETEDAGRNGS